MGDEQGFKDFLTQVMGGGPHPKQVGIPPTEDEQAVSLLMYATALTESIFSDLRRIQSLALPGNPDIDDFRNHLSRIITVRQTVMYHLGAIQFIIQYMRKQRDAGIFLNAREKHILGLESLCDEAENLLTELASLFVSALEIYVEYRKSIN